MKSNDKTREQLLKEIDLLKIKITELEKSETKRKQAEGALAESELQFRSLSDASMEGIGIIQDGNVLIANSKSSEIFGYDHFEIIGKSMIEFVALESRNLVLKNFREKFKKPFEIVAIRKNGSKFLAEV
ncbi:MAG: PAS domain-containing protein, partial [Candidatus Cloacimonetes bacterium]|nr:PAS domain-containing protein [Candidatus Cloacimonadota bacterium]